VKLFIVLLAFLAPAWAAGPALDLPPAAPVVDEARLMSSSEDAQLDQLVRDIKARSGVEITVYIAKSLQDRSIEDFSIDVARKWGLGNKKEDRGLLLVIAPTERQMRLEVGGGLEGDVTDLFARHVLDDGLRPYFRQGRYYDGILGALQVVQEKVPLGLEASVAPTPPSQRGGGIPIRGNLIFWFIVVIFLLSRFSRLGMLGMFLGGGGRGGGSWGGGGGGGGSWGGGGGGFSGGGSSSSW
jgi:uncharacterized protein